MFYLLIIAAAAFFIAHVFLLLASFSGSHLVKKRYFYSHLTLWITGLVVFAMALLYSGSNQSGFLDYFDTPFKKAMILVATFALSFVAHAIVRYLVLPLMNKSKSS
jgi:hypothetical protein